MASKGPGQEEGGVEAERPYHHLPALPRDSRGSLEVFNPSSAASSAFRPAAKSTSPFIAAGNVDVGKAAQRAAEWGLVLQTDEHTGRPQGVAARTSGAGGSSRNSSEDKSSGGAALPRVSEELRAALSAFQQTFVVSDASRPDHPIMYASAGFFDMTGYTSKEVVGRNCRFLQGSGTDPSEIAKIRKALAAGSNYCGRVLNYKKDGTPFWNLLTIAPIKDEDGSLQSLISRLLYTLPRHQVHLPLHCRGECGCGEGGAAGGRVGPRAPDRRAQGPPPGSGRPHLRGRRLGPQQLRGQERRRGGAPLGVGGAPGGAVGVPADVHGVGPDHPIMYASAAFFDMTSYTSKEVVGRNW